MKNIFEQLLNFKFYDILKIFLPIGDKDEKIIIITYLLYFIILFF